MFVRFGHLKVHWIVPLLGGGVVIVRDIPLPLPAVATDGEQLNGLLPSEQLVHPEFEEPSGGGGGGGFN